VWWVFFFQVRWQAAAVDKNNKPVHTL
jgi:hypothetical protein